MRLDQAMLFVTDLERMTAFYRDVIGFRLIAATRRPDWVEFKTDGMGFALHAIPPHAAPPVEAAFTPAAREHQSCKLIFSVDDVDLALTRLEALGVSILHRPWGGWDFLDPEGNVLGVRSTTA